MMILDIPQQKTMLFLARNQKDGDPVNCFLNDRPELHIIDQVKVGYRHAWWTQIHWVGYEGESHI